MEIYREFSFDAAHSLPFSPPGHKCKELHGHTYHLKVYVKGEPDEHCGWIMDFKELKEIVSPVIEELDHKLINNIDGLENPTAENVTVWIWNRLKGALPRLSRIELKETNSSGVVYTGD